MSTIDRRVVDMEFNNKQFESGVKSSVDSLGKLKQGLKLDESARSLANLSDIGKKFSLQGISDGVSHISSSFSAMGVVGFTVLQNLTNMLIDLGKKAINAAFGLDEMRSGFAGFEVKTNAVKTVMSGTGETIDEVTKSLDELNNYSDRTIYSFQDMTENISKFTNAGMSSKQAATAIQGISNVAAISGANTGEAARAMYNFGQAIQQGSVRLMDWKSIENANMATIGFKEQLIATAVALGTLKKQADGTYKTLNGGEALTATKNFNGSLEKEWLTTKVLIQTLSDYASQETEIGKKANEAAQSVRTFTQLMATLQDSAKTGWTKTWQLIVGDLNESTTLFTLLNDKFGGIASASAKARIDLLKGWKDLGGRDILFKSLQNAIEGLLRIMGPIKDAFETWFPPATANQLVIITKNIEKFSEKLKLSDENLGRIKRTFLGIFSVFYGIGEIISGLIRGILRLGGAIGPSTDGFLEFTAKIGDWLVNLRHAIKYTDIFEKGFDKIKEAFAKVRDFVTPAIKALKEFIAQLGPIFDKISEFFTKIKSRLSEAFSGFKEVNTSGITSFVSKIGIKFQPLVKIIEGVGKVFAWIGQVVVKLFPIFAKFGSIVGNALSGLGKSIMNGIDKIDYTNLFNGLNGGLLAALLIAIKKFAVSGTSAFGGISDILGGVKDSLSAWQKDLQAKTLLTIASAIAILVVSLIALSLVNPEKLAGALIAITTMFAELSATMKAISGISGGKGAAQVAGEMLIISGAVLILSLAVANLARLDPEALTNGLIAVGVVLAELVVFMKVSNANGMAVGQTAGFLMLAIAVNILGIAVKKFSDLDPEKMKQGLLAIGIILTELAAFTKITGNAKSVIATSISLAIVAGSMLIFVRVIKQLGDLSPETIGKGLGAMAGSLAIVALALQSMPKDMIVKSLSLVVIASALTILSKVLIVLGNMSWEQIARGLVSMGGGLLIIAGAVRIMPKDMIFVGAGLVVVASALVILAKALTSMGGMSWQQVATGLTVLAGSMLILVVALNAMTGALPGAAAVLVVSAALLMLTPVLQALGNMSLEQIGLAMLTLAAAFTVLGVAAYLLTPVVPTLLALAGVMALVGIAALAVGAGILAFSAGLAALAISGAAGAAALVVVVTTLLSLIPLIVEKIVSAIILFANLITAGAPALVQAITVTLLAVVAGIVVLVPVFVDAILLLINSLLQSLVASLPSILQAGMDIIMILLKGIRDNIGGIVTVAIEAITKFIDAVASKLPDVINSAFNLIVTFLNGLSTAIDINMPIIIAAVNRIIKSILDGLVNGITGGIGSVVAAIVDLGNKALQALKNAIKAHSPSEETTDIGEDYTSGFVKGIIKYADKAGNAGKYLGDKALSGLSRTISQISDSVNQNFDMNPTIRPVVDLSNVIAGGKDVSKIFGSQSLSIAGTSSRLSAMSSSLLGSKYDETQINQPTGQQAPVVSFTQNNYSPTALSRIEIYRQTKNQITMLRGLVKN